MGSNLQIFLKLNYCCVFREHNCTSRFLHFLENISLFLLKKNMLINIRDFLRKQSSILIFDKFKDTDIYPCVLLLKIFLEDPPLYLRISISMIQDSLSLHTYKENFTFTFPRRSNGSSHFVSIMIQID